MSRLVLATYGTAVYAFFLATFVYAVAFVGGFVVPKTIDSGDAGGLGLAVVVDLVVLTIFAVQHSVMARPAFKRRWTKIVPPAAERSTYVLFASLALALLMAAWRPIPEPVWTIADPLGRAVVFGVFWLGWVVLLTSTFLISHFELFGLKQSFASTQEVASPVLRTPFLYRFVRHPIYVGFLLAFWAAPTMSVGHLLFAIATTAYILIGIALEERDLVETFGDGYRRYRREVGMLFPRLGARPDASRTRVR